MARFCPDSMSVTSEAIRKLSSWLNALHRFKVAFAAAEQTALWEHDPVTTPHNLPEIVDDLRKTLGAKLVAYIAGVSETRTVREWAEAARRPPPAAEDRLRLAHRIVTLIGQSEGVAIVPIWFQGMNPQLGERSPARVLHDDSFDEAGARVLAAAIALVGTTDTEPISEGPNEVAAKNPLRAAGSLVEPDQALPIAERPSVRTALRQETLLTEARTTNDVARLLGVSTGRVRQRNGEGTLFSMSGANRRLRFPRFQFTDRGELPGWGTVCKALPEHANPVAVEYFLSHTHPDLAGGDITPGQWLAAGKPAEPVAALVAQAFTIR